MNGSQDQLAISLVSVEEDDKVATTLLVTGNKAFRTRAVQVELIEIPGQSSS